MVTSSTNCKSFVQGPTVSVIVGITAVGDGVVVDGGKVGRGCVGGTKGVGGVGEAQETSVRIKMNADNDFVRLVLSAFIYVSLNKSPQSAQSFFFTNSPWTQ